MIEQTNAVHPWNCFRSVKGRIPGSFGDRSLSYFQLSGTVDRFGLTIGLRKCSKGKPAWSQCNRVFTGLLSQPILTSFSALRLNSTTQTVHFFSLLDVPQLRSNYGRLKSCRQIPVDLKILLEPARPWRQSHPRHLAQNQRNRAWRQK